MKKPLIRKGVKMPEGLTGSEGRQGQYLIKPNESINLFPEDEREEAENIASIHARYIA